VEDHENALRVAVAAILSPQGTIESYQSLINYLKARTGKNVVLIQRKTYQETNNLLARRVVDVAFVCTGAYMQGRNYMDVLVIPQIDGKITWRCVRLYRSAFQLRLSRSGFPPERDRRNAGRIFCPYDLHLQP